MDLNADLSFPRPGESFSVDTLCLRKKGNIFKMILAEKWGGHGPRGPSRSYAYGKRKEKTIEQSSCYTYLPNDDSTVNFQSWTEKCR